MAINDQIKKFKAPAVVKLGEYALALPVVLVGAYYLFAEDLVRDTARVEAEIVADSILTVQSEEREEINTKLEILTNYMKLQNPELYEKAKSLEED